MLMQNFTQADMRERAAAVAASDSGRHSADSSPVSWAATSRSRASWGRAPLHADVADQGQVANLCWDSVA